MIIKLCAWMRLNVARQTRFKGHKSMRDGCLSWKEVFSLDRIPTFIIYRNRCLWNNWFCAYKRATFEFACFAQWCFVSTDYQLLQYTEINIFESVAFVGTKDTLLSLRVLNSGVSFWKKRHFWVCVGRPRTFLVAQTETKTETDRDRQTITCI